MLDNFSICYILKDDGEATTPFLRSSSASPERAEALQHINLLPMNIPELLSSREEVARMRLDSIYHGRIVEFISHYNEIETLPYTYKVVLFEDRITGLESAPHILRMALHENLASIDAPFFKTVTIDTLRDFYFSNIQAKNEIYKDLEDRYATQELMIARTQTSRNINTNCNIETARSVGFVTACSAGNSARNNTEQSINFLNLIRNDLSANLPSNTALPRSDYLITDFSIDLEYSINAKNYTKHTLLRNNVPECLDIADSITYAKSQHNIDIETNNEHLKAYRQEQYLSSTVNSLYAASTLTPEIKIDICNNDLFPITSAMGDNIRSNRTKSLNKQMRTFTETVLSKSNTLLDYVSSSFNRQIKIVSNFPLEWTSLNGLPLMIRHNVSRVFSSPGTIKEKLLLKNHEVAMSLDDINNILVLSSFAEGEAISNHLRDRLKSAIKVSDDPDLRATVDAEAGPQAYSLDVAPKVVFETVKNKEEIIAALNKHRYGIVIFDMHGGHAKNGDGLLELSHELLHPYDLVGKASVPPIVILSACDTSPADRSHFNVANAFLCAGAITVLASTYPIRSLEAARYIERLYMRIRFYLPERLYSVGRSLRWSEFITSLNRRVFFDAFIMHLKKKYKHIPIGQIKAARKKALHALELNPNRFMDDVYFILTKITSLPKTTIANELITQFTYCECLNYVQIGFPERILIRAKDLAIPVQA